jgi:hypothetical protein
MVSRFKSKICLFWLSPQGCPYGPRCLYAHGSDDLRVPPGAAGGGADAAGGDGGGGGGGAGGEGVSQDALSNAR